MPLGDEIELRGANRPLRLWTVPGTERAGGPGATAGTVDGGVAEDASSEDGAGRASVAFVDGAGLSDR
jgi:hypothetical protein